VRTAKDIPVELEKVHRQFQGWRQRRRGREPIPARLWAAAARVAREYGVNATSKALSLDFNKLKAHVNRKQAGKKRNAEAAPRFLELVTTGHAGGAECVIELEGPRGRMRIELKGSAAADLVRLSQMLWERE
jgi:hypothetical protein